MSRILIMAGGTGGHIFPALEVAHSLRADGCEISWLGSRGGMEVGLVEQAGFDGDWISISGVRGKGLMTYVMAPLRIITSIFQALRVMRKRRPDTVLGMGGFASGPGGVAAWLLRRPLIIHEQNAVAGTTNSLLSRLAQHVFSAFPDSFSSRLAKRRHVEVVGNPVRADIVAIAPPEQRLTTRSGPLHVLILGGSQGALALNEYVPNELSSLAKTHDLIVHHQAGSKTLPLARAAYKEATVEVRLDAFIDDMAAAYAWADIAICRSGALTVSELAAAGVASVLIPFPHAIDDHQTANAQFLVAVGAARLLPQAECKPGKLESILREIVTERARVVAMAAAGRAQAKTDAASRVATRCIEVAAGISQ